MKRVCSLILSLCLVLSICACGKKAETVEGPSWQEQYDLGIRYLSEGNYEEAIIAFTAAIEIDPKRGDAYTGLADVYIAQGDIAAAIDILRQGGQLTSDATLFEWADRLEQEMSGQRSQLSPGRGDPPPDLSGGDRGRPFRRWAAGALRCRK